ncbi:MAG: 2OG-Fe(II) oxygenase [Gammaproteobacteria bacterium]|nr:2OG-Fe(II) oxygenase [Gammaproteobacteria bacterium]MDH3466019.1 2OG-Fe(II) oxygenase [Gammaproteobacteria bacterium]
MSDDESHPSIIELKPGSFIYTKSAALSLTLCDEIVDRFEAHPDQHYIGRIGQRAESQPGIKRSTDLRISGRADWRDVDRQLFRSLSDALSEMSITHPFFRVNSFQDIGYNLQRTNPDEYYDWHIDSGPGEFSQRQLVAIWYLNDVPGPGGETQFYFHDLSVQPERGKLLLFPPFWTHLHRGNKVASTIKYIATTWVSFAPTQSSGSK